MNSEFDYKRICYIRYSLMKLDASTAHSIFVCWILFFIRMIGYLFRSPYTYKKVDKIFVPLPSANNRRSTQPILDAMSHKNYTCVEHMFNFLPLGKIYLKSIINSGGFMRMYRMSSKQEKQMIRANFLEFAPAEELFKAIGEFYDLNPQIKLLIVSNDHIPFMRSYIEQARMHGVKTVYSQHASVSEFFPPLEFDYSFLDGEESFKKYQSVGVIKGKVFLIGSPRFDVITSLGRKHSDLVGIAFNQLDDNYKILSLVNKLRSNGFNNIVVRPHPQQDKTNPDWSMFTSVGCEISHPLQENPFNFLSRISFLVSGASSIHLEAALLRIPSAIYNMQAHEGELDYYGYAKMKLTTLASTVEDVVELIKNPAMPSDQTIRYYDAAFGTAYDGKSAFLMAKIIDAYLDGKEEETTNLLFEKTADGCFVM